MNIFSKIFVLLLLLIPFVPRLNTIDKIGVQWFVFSIVVFIFYSVYFFRFHKKLFSLKSNGFLFYALFIFIAFLSIFWAHNSVVSIIDFLRLFSVFISVLIIANSYKPLLDSPNYILFLLYAYTFFELLSFYSFWDPLFSKSFFLPSQYIVGLSGNKNIAAISLCIKLPFLLFTATKSKLNLTISFFLVSCSVFVIMAINSRTSLLALILIFIIWMLFSLFQFIVKRGSVFSLVSLLSFVLPFSIFTYLSSSQNILSRVSSISPTEVNSNGRFELWRNAFDYITHNPFGCGLGNWKIESMPYWKFLMTDYVVPYHAHNEFFEYTTELGVIGGLIFIIFILYLFKYAFLDILRSNSFFTLAIFLSLGVYFLDMSLNFPSERFLIQLPFIFLLVLIFIRKHERHA